MIVAVTGGRGVVGGFLIEHLLAHGDRVRALARAPAPGNPGPVEWITGSLPDEEPLAALLAGAEAIVHCAFAHAPGRYRGGEGDDVTGFWQRNLGATLAVLEAARQARVGRVVLLSSRAVFDGRPPGEMADDAAPVPTGHYGALKVAEEALATACSDAELTVCAIRATGVYGCRTPVHASKWYELACAVRDGAPAVPARRGTEVHGLDLAAAIRCLLAAPVERVAGRTFNCADLEVDHRMLVAGLAARLGVEPVLPESGVPVARPMRCDALSALGWRPGGRARLDATLDQLAAAVGGGGSATATN